jgi:hypothetical protein
MFVGGSFDALYGMTLSPFITVNSGPPFNINTGQDFNGDSIFNDRPAWATDVTRTGVMRTPYGAFDLRPLPAQTIILRKLDNGRGQFAVNLRLSRSFSFGQRTGKAASQSPSAPPALSGHGGGPGGHGDVHAGGSPSADSRYSVTLSVSARNLFNSVNLAPPVGNLSSPAFGTSMATVGRSSANRTIEVQIAVFVLWQRQARRLALHVQRRMSSQHQ